jgi:hypothetical protein
LQSDSQCASGGVPIAVEIATRLPVIQ